MTSVDPSLLDQPPESNGRAAVFAGGRPKLGPALVIVALAVGISGAGAIFALVGSNSPPAPAVHPGVAVGHTGLSVASATRDFKAVTSNGDPPADVLSAIVVPAGSHLANAARVGSGVELYDSQVLIRVDAEPARVVAFYDVELRSLGWIDRSTSATASNGTELLAEHASADGYYWELGVVVNRAATSLSPALGGSSVAPASAVELRLFEVDDAE
jgi:hypothetical protein